MQLAVEVMSIGPLSPLTLMTLHTTVGYIELHIAVEDHIKEKSKDLDVIVWKE